MTVKSLLPVGFDRPAAVRSLPPFATLQQEMDRLSEGFWQGGPSQPLLPSMDLGESDTDIEIPVELPGLEENDVEINIADNILIIRGEKRSGREETDADCSLIEGSHGSFARTVELPAGTNAGAIRAEMSNEVLKVAVAKPAPALTRTIDIKPAAQARTFTP